MPTCCSTLESSKRLDISYVVRRDLESTAEDYSGDAAVPGTPASRNLSGTSSGSRTKLDSEDSSYDSDYENSDPVATPDGRTPSCRHRGHSHFQQPQHEDVSRTVSDTLCAEFEEYVGCCVGETFDESEGEGPLLSDPDYASRVEFALKLGYTVRQAQVALEKLGPAPEQNELLAELIRLGAACVRPPSGESAGVGGGGHAPLLALPSGPLSGETAGVVVSDAGEDGGDGQRGILRTVVIDGSNVAMSHGNKEVFSCRGIKLCVDWFKARGHREITVFVPMWRKETSRPDNVTKDQELLFELERERLLVFTPSRQMGGRRMACHDDRYILRLATMTDGIVVSNDNYRDLVSENPEFKRVVEERLLMYSFVTDRFMPPDDPLGRHGPSLDTFLRLQARPAEPVAPHCPYGKKCTYGNKCKYYHPERGNLPHKSVSEQLAEQAKKQIQEVNARRSTGAVRVHDADGQRLKATMSLPLPGSTPLERMPAKTPLSRTRSHNPPSLIQPADANSDRSSPQQQLQQHQPHRSSQEFDVRLRDPGHDRRPDDTSGWSSLNFAGADHQHHQHHHHHLPVLQHHHPSPGRPMEAAQPAATSEAGAAVNRHNKLARQLTLNPTYDPRLQVMRNCLQRRQNTVAGESTSGSSSGDTERSSADHHMPLVRHCSDGVPGTTGSGLRGSAESLHRSVTRIASAPESFCHWPPPSHPPPPSAGRMPQFEVSAPPPPYFWGLHPPPQLPGGLTPSWHTGPPPPPHAANTAEERRRAHFYHLSKVFPEEQVRAAMDAHPEETDPQAICATILAMFPRPR